MRKNGTPHSGDELKGQYYDYNIVRLHLVNYMIIIGLRSSEIFGTL